MHELLMRHGQYCEVGRCRIQTGWFIYVLVVLHALMLHLDGHLHAMFRHKRPRHVLRREGGHCQIQAKMFICVLWVELLLQWARGVVWYKMLVSISWLIIWV